MLQILNYVIKTWKCFKISQTKIPHTNAMKQTLIPAACEFLAQTASETNMGLISYNTLLIVRQKFCTSNR